MIPFKEYYKISFEAIKNFIDKEPLDFRLEQFEQDKKETSIKKLVISYLIDKPKISSLMPVNLPGSFNYERIYKQVVINNNEVEDILLFEK